MQEKLRFLSLSSSSDGNCFYLGTQSGGILIDAGIGVRKILSTLADNNIDIESIRALFVTHDHIDHTRAVCSLSERRGVPLYATAKTIEAINRSSLTSKLTSNTNIIEKQQSITIGDMVVTPFELLHDAFDCVGYSIEAFGKRFTLMTDLGCVTQTVSHYISISNYLVIESNYDRDMLAANTNYPYILKQRIDGNYGHLCNEQTAQALCENFHNDLKHIWLCHISRDNNTPQLALKTICDSLCGCNVEIEPLERCNPSPLFLL